MLSVHKYAVGGGRVDAINNHFNSNCGELTKNDEIVVSYRMADDNSMVKCSGADDVSRRGHVDGVAREARCVFFVFFH